MEINTQVFSEVHEIFHLANTSPDPNYFMSRIIHFLFHQVSADSSVFYLPKKSGKSKGGIEVNLDENYVRQYKEYYHQYDPFQKIGDFSRQEVVRVEDLIDYKTFMSTEFYCDFLRPQKIHHKLYIRLSAGGKDYGRIGLYRSAKEKNFSGKEVRLLTMISPYLGNALDHHALLSENKQKKIFLDIIDENSSQGLLLFDESLHLIDMNLPARQFCRDLAGERSCRDEESHIPSILLEDCRAMADGKDRCRKNQWVPARHRIVRIGNSREMGVSSRMIHKETAPENRSLFLVSIEPNHPSIEIDPNRLEEIYKLTGRECEILRHVFHGLRNVEIAKKVFLSEITVKKHVQNIFKKLEVKNRTSAVRKILEDHQKVVWPRP